VDVRTPLSVPDAPAGSIGQVRRTGNREVVWVGLKVGLGLEERRSGAAYTTLDLWRALVIYRPRPHKKFHDIKFDSINEA
jgi:hypothetical protein